MINCATFPRSGHNLLQRVVLQSSLALNKADGKEGRGKYKRELFRNHDSGLEWDKPSNFNKFGQDQTIVQLRNPLESLISLFLLRHSKFGVDHKVQGTKDRWEAFARSKILYWIKFARVWWMENPNANKILLPYADCMADPVSSYSRVLKFVGLPVPDDFPKVLKYLRIYRRRRIQDFKYYDQRFYSEILDMAKPEIKGVFKNF